MRNLPTIIKQAAVLCLVLCSAFCGGCDKESLRFEATEKAGWIRCSSKSGGFSVAFPGKPKTVVSEEELAKGIKIQIHSFTLEPSKTTAFSVLYNDFPDFVLKAQTSALFDGGQNSALGQSGRLISTENGTLDSYPTRLVRFEKPTSGYVVELKMVLVKKRLYQLIFVSKPSDDVSGNGKFFFDSFKLESE